VVMVGVMVAQCSGGRPHNMLVDNMLGQRIFLRFYFSRSNEKVVMIVCVLIF